MRVWLATIVIATTACSAPPGTGATDASARDGTTADADAPEAGTLFHEQSSNAGLANAPPVYGRGAAFVDVDGDGWEDLWQSDSAGGSALYLNRGDGTFSRVSLGIAPEDVYRNWAGSWGDFDNDGDPDLFLANGGYEGVSHCALYRNDLSSTGSFTNISDAAGILPIEDDWWGASFADYDNDSHLDIAVQSVGFEGTESVLLPTLLLYHNRGDGTFEEVSSALGIPMITGEMKNPVWIDYDADGDPDLFIPMGGLGRLYLFRNDGDAFVETPMDIVAPPEAEEDASLGWYPAFTAAAADFNQDGIDDIYLGRWSYQDYVLVNNGDGTFTRLGTEIGLDTALAPASEENTMGLAIGDLNNDGWPDIVLGTGEPFYQRPPLVYCSDGEALGFHRCSADFVAGHEMSWHHGATMADPDHDGDTDLFWSLGGHLEGVPDEAVRPAYYVQKPPAPPNTAVVHLVGTASNRSAVGARIVVTGTETHYYTVRGAQGFQSQNSDWIPVYLGGAGEATLRIEWPSGAETSISITPGARIEIIE